MVLNQWQLGNPRRLQADYLRHNSPKAVTKFVAKIESWDISF